MLSDSHSLNEQIFKALYFAKDEEELIQVIQKYPNVFKDENWKPLGGNQSNYAIVKNQQAIPIASLIEKVTNSIDAILTKKCLKAGISTEGKDAPKSMQEAIDRFFPNSNWDLPKYKRKQAEEIQIIADGNGPRKPKRHLPTSVIIYDNGEGQHPEDFESTFLSLVKGNKNKIKFVQGKYNMGGSGALVFCGKKRYQLIASKRYDNTGELGFTLIREHEKKESDQSKETWFEFLVFENKIRAFPIKELNLNLENRNFTTGTIIKLYSYQFPKGYSGFAQDLNQSINEFLFTPALPILTKDTMLRYPNNKVLVTDLFGLKRRLHKEKDEYLADEFSELFMDELFGEMKVSCFVFKSKIKNNNLKDSKGIIAKRYFKNGMSVIFSMNGQVHGHYKSEFITKSLKLNLLKNHLLIHVDCTDIKYEFRKELFMASRDRMKNGDETQQLRKYLAGKLGKANGRLKEIEKRRKQAANVDTSSSSEELLRSFSKNLPINNDLMKLLGDAFKIELKKDKKVEHKKKESIPNKNQQAPFKPERYPTKFKIDKSKNNPIDAIVVHVNGEKQIKFDTNVDDDYFDRIDDPGDLKIAILKIKNNETDGGNEKGDSVEVSDVFNVNKSSPNKGKIKISINPKEHLNVGDELQLKVSLSSFGEEELDEIFWVKIAETEKPQEKIPKKENNNEPLGLPKMKLAYKNENGLPENAITWEAAEDATTEEMITVPL